jgi:hypothetical protein
MKTTAVDGDRLTQREIELLCEKARELDIPMVTPEKWRETTGQSEDQLTRFVQECCNLHSIRRFLSGAEELGPYAKLVVYTTMPGSKAYFLTSMKPEFARQNIQ